MSVRKKFILLSIVFIIVIGIFAYFNYFVSDKTISVHLELKNLEPCKEHFFGTDWLGRDMFVRTIKGMNISMKVGIITAFCSTAVSLIMGLLASAFGKAADEFILWMIDLFLGIPQLLVCVLISVCVGGGMKGVIVGVAATHWPNLAKVIRMEVMKIRESDYIVFSRQGGKNKMWIAIQHFIPHIISKLVVAVIVMFPHAILHEASITFLGFGLSPQIPAIGIILSEATKYLSSRLWWLAVCPGIVLLIVVKLFDSLGTKLSMILDCHSAQM